MRKPEVRNRSALLSAVLICFAIGLHIAERRRPLRRRVEPALPHLLRNLAVALVAGATQAAFERPLLRRVTRHVERKRLGLLHLEPLPPAVRGILAVVLMDYTLYLWHVLMHRVPALWRLHRPHHADRDLDSSTALRFHFTELVASVPWRALQVRLLGVRGADYERWQQFTLACILFHHSNLRLPEKLERVVGVLFATPRMHGIHHSRRDDEMNSNWSSGLSLWDRLHRTLRQDVPQAEIRIGVPGLGPRRTRLLPMLLLPFRRFP